MERTDAEWRLLHDLTERAVADARAEMVRQGFDPVGSSRAHKIAGGLRAIIPGDVRVRLGLNWPI